MTQATEYQRMARVIESPADAKIMESFDEDIEISIDLGDIPASSVNGNGDILIYSGTTLVVAGDFFVMGQVTVRGSLSVKGRIFASKGIFLHGDGAPSKTRGQVQQFFIGE